MVIFEDKEIAKDPVQELHDVHAPNEAREGHVVNLLNSLMRKREGGSYHHQDPNRGHLSSSDGCARQNYLKYVHKLDEDLDVPENDVKSNWTFSHGDAVHEMIQDMLVEELGKKHVTIEETVKFQLKGDYYIYGHADIVIRGISSAEVVNDALPDGVNLMTEGFDGFPDPFVIDIKTKSEFTYYSYPDKAHARTVPKEGNLMQLNGYMGILGAKFGCLLYYSKRNDHLEEYWVEFNEDMFQEAQDNITGVLDAVHSGDPSQAERNAESYMCEKFCKYYKNGMCPGVDGVEPHDNWEGDPEEVEFADPEWEQ